jgi:argininosuccinate lyase
VSASAGPVSPGATGEGNKLWGGRFSGTVDPEIHRFTASLPFDRRLARYDLLGSLAHARMLLDTGILGQADGASILTGLSGMLTDLEAGDLLVEGDDEDVHSWLERVLIERVGEPGRRLHTARSRNDQTATALRLYVRDALAGVLAGVSELQAVWLDQAAGHIETWLPGYTHLQRAQPVSLAHQLLAHVWALGADARRLRAAWLAAGVSPLGAGALAGTPWPIDPRRTAALLGFEAAFANSLLAVADRDYVAEAAFACALLLVHLSRWAEEVVLWTSTEFAYAALDDSVAKGSSLMPQKRNPEPAELLRGKSGRVIGDLVALLTMLKGLPLAYNSDLQEDKEAVFDALDTAAGALRATAVLARGLRFRPAHMAAALVAGFLTATDLADHLVARGVPFRTAHAQAGQAVRAAEALGATLWALSPEDLAAACPAADPAVVARLTPAASARAHASPGGPAPERVREQLAAARAEQAALVAWLGERADPPIYQAHQAGRLLDEALS